MIDLFKLKSNTGSDVILDTVTITTTGSIIYFNYDILNTNRTSIYTNLISNDLIGIGFDDTSTLSSNMCIDNINLICDNINGFDLSNNCDKMHWNSNISIYVLSSIESEMINTDMSALGLTLEGEIDNILNILTLIKLGMFSLAITKLTSLERNIFFTESRISRYINALTSANLST